MGKSSEDLIANVNASETMPENSPDAYPMEIIPRNASKLPLTLTWTPFQLQLEEIPFRNLGPDRNFFGSTINYSSFENGNASSRGESSSGYEIRSYETIASYLQTSAGDFRESSKTDYRKFLARIFTEIFGKADSNIIYSCQKCDFVRVMTRKNVHQARIIPSHALGHLLEPAYQCKSCGFESNYMRQHVEEAHGRFDYDEFLQMKPDILLQVIQNFFECFPVFEEAQSEIESSVENFPQISHKMEFENPGDSEIGHSNKSDNENPDAMDENSSSPLILSSNHCAVCFDSEYTESFPRTENKVDHALIHCSTSGETLKESLKLCFPFLNSTQIESVQLPENPKSLESSSADGDEISDSATINQLMEDEPEKEKKKVRNSENLKVKSELVIRVENRLENNSHESENDVCPSQNQLQEKIANHTTPRGLDDSQGNSKTKPTKSVRFLDGGDCNNSPPSTAKDENSPNLMPSQIIQTPTNESADLQKLWTHIDKLIPKIRSKMGNKEASCAICNQSWRKRNSNFTRTIRQHPFKHLTQPAFQCGVCKKKFNNVERHLTEKHKGARKESSNSTYLPNMEPAVYDIFAKCFSNYF